MISASPYDQGVRAHLGGVPRCLNPYHNDEHSMKAWDDGWDHAVEHREKIEADHAEG